MVGVGGGAKEREGRLGRVWARWRQVSFKAIGVQCRGASRAEKQIGSGVEGQGKSL